MSRGAALVVMVAAATVACGVGAEPFESDRWIAGSELGRGAMAKDLVRSEVMIGKTRNDTLKILGPPNEETELKLGYRIDLGHKFGSEPWLYTLNIRFGAESGLVERTWIDD